ncbi:DUF502 domain-containing protein [Rhodoplanes sp. TEM]|uniref:DUF502 domain-containing protein n=1 Tax=Rhodoplanes tepidamans TaxID=200616 RepID=A0ABT5JHS7_RHOTP|nr:MULTISPECIES: DUF502 domain-containing protein [Rhodoplanes]MDC7789250.1 DUF502 domain-containing protein [Rhodoplanes tepidamans]MDC7985812.1 DUF502 domain-containing protein [Rhodoplanes sp. TEM]MDQ0358862.1 putative membrane protein [Rhodoplanes tepidamans]
MTETSKPPADKSDKPILHPDPRPGAGARLRNYFLTGLVVAGPVAITLWLTWSFVTWVDALVQPFIPMQYRPETYLPWRIPGTGLIIAFLALTMLGFFTANLVGRTLVEFGERLLDRMPLVRSLYKGLKQVFETLFSETGSSFRKVALIEFPSPGMWSLVFLSAPPGQQVSERLPAEEHVSCFMPCTPNPTTGFFFYVPKSRLIELDMSVEAAAKLVMSAGMIQPNGDGQKKLAALAAAAQTVQAAQAAGRAAAEADADAGETPRKAEVAAG